MRIVFFLTTCFLFLGFGNLKNFAHEVDQSSPPTGQSLRDMGNYWNQLIFRVLFDGVEQANQGIEAAKKSWIPDPGGSRLTMSQSPTTLAKCVRSQLPSAMALIENM